MGYGSGATVFNYLIDPLSAITEKANKLGISIVSYGKLTNTTEENYGVTTTIGHEDITGVQDLLTRNTDIDLCLIFIMANSGEELLYLERSHGDRYDMNAWHNGNELVKNVTQSSSCRKKVVVINAPGPINVDTWIDDVDGVVFSGMGGGESGNETKAAETFYTAETECTGNRQHPCRCTGSDVDQLLCLLPARG